MTTGKIVFGDEIRSYQWPGETGRFLLNSEDTHGRYTLMDVTTSVRGGPPTHQHEHEDEAFLVLEGAYEIRLGDDTFLVTPGNLVYGPRGIPHGFRTVGDAPGRMLVIATPGGVEGFFIGLSEIMGRGGRPDPQEIQDHAARFGITSLDAMTGPGGPPVAAQSQPPPLLLYPPVPVLLDPTDPAQ